MKEIGEVNMHELGAETLALKQQMLAVSGAVGLMLEQMLRDGSDEAQLEQLRAAQANLEAIESLAGDTVDTIETTQLPDPEPAPDEEEAYQFFRRFIRRKDSAMFTKAELREHFERLNVQLPNDGREFDEYFNNWSADLLAEAAQEGSKVDLVSLKQGRQTFYAYAKIVRPGKAQPPTEPEPDTALPDAATTPIAAPTVEPMPDALPPARLQAIITENIATKANALLPKIAVQTGLDLVSVADRVNQLITSGALFTDRRQGTLYYVLEKPEERSKATGRVAKTEQFNELDQRRAFSILEVFLQSGRHVNQRLTAQQLAAEMDVAADEENIKRIGRELSKLGVTVHGKTKVRGSRNSRTREAFKLGLASREVRDLLRTDEGWRRLTDAMTTGQRFELDETV